MKSPRKLLEIDLLSSHFIRHLLNRKKSRKKIALLKLTPISLNRINRKIKTPILQIISQKISLLRNYT